MEIEILKKAGLTESQAKGYLALITNGEKTPSELAAIIDESRTNAYAIVDKLEKLGLATKKANSKKTIYIASHPSAVEALAEKRRKLVSKNEQEIKQNMSSLTDLFYTFKELPGARTLEGVDGIKTAYNDILKTNKDHYLLRSVYDIKVLGSEFMEKFIEKRVKLGIHTHALAHDTESARRHIKEGKDQQWLYHRHTLPKGYYSAPVEIDVYGDKVALIAYGETQMATIITSPPIAEAMRQIIKLIISLIEQ